MQYIFGITGGTGCGKTTVLNILSEMGFHVLDCDQLYHNLLKTSVPMLRAINTTFPGVVQNGILQRKLLGQKVFSDKKALGLLNATVWPFVYSAVKQQIDAAAPQNCAIDAIGLFESGLADLCTHTIAVTAPTDVRISRLIARDNISEEYAALRIQAQEENETFAAKCDIVLDNHFPTQAEFRLYAAKILKETIL